MEVKKTAILLLNVGTPDSTKVKDVRRYLSEFLNDKRVIDLPYLLRKFLVNFIIVPFRAPKSAKLYEKLWTKEGSPLIVNGNRLAQALQKEIPTSKIVLAMRYQNPSLANALQTIKNEGFEKLIVVPLFPQYASSSTGTAVEAVLSEIQKWQAIPEVVTVSQFYNHPAFIAAFTSRIQSYKPETFDHVIFSYHGLPVRHIQKIHPETPCSTCTCETEFPAHGTFCYKATCYETSRLLAKSLCLKRDDYTVSFQSRLSKNWITPFTDKILPELAQQGKRSVLITAPSFVADCLETTVELGIDYKRFFTEAGGDELTMVESLNAEPVWVNALKEILPDLFLLVRSF